MALPKATTYDGARQEFLSLYPNRVQPILRPPSCKTWVSVSKHWPLPDEQIERAIGLQDQSLWGCRWGEYTRFAVLDIDAESKYHSAQELQKLFAALAGSGLKGTVYHSSSSTGWHIYLFFEHWQNCTEVQETLKSWLTATGYEIRNGTLEVFPSGNGLRFPLQAGFAWLAADTTVLLRREDLTTEQAMARFLNDLHETANDWTAAKELIDSQLEARQGFVRNPATSLFESRQESDLEHDAHEERVSTDDFAGLFGYRLIEEKYQAGQAYWQTGLTANGQRHDAILAVEHYLWHGDESIGLPAMPGQPNDRLRFELIRAWLEQKHNGHCNHIRRGNWRKVEAQIRRAVVWRRPTGSVVRQPYLIGDRAMARLIALYKSTGRVWSPDDFRKGNEGRRENARQKISHAFELLTAQGRRVTLRQLMRLTGCHKDTINKHADIWRISIESITRVAGDLNPLLDLDHTTGGGPVPASSGSEKSFLPPPVVADSGDFPVVRESSRQLQALPLRGWLRFAPKAPRTGRFNGKSKSKRQPPPNASVRAGVRSVRAPEPARPPPNAV